MNHALTAAYLCGQGALKPNRSTSEVHLLPFQLHILTVLEYIPSQSVGSVPKLTAKLQNLSAKTARIQRRVLSLAPFPYFTAQTEHSH